MTSCSATRRNDEREGSSLVKLVRPLWLPVRADRRFFALEPNFLEPEQPLQRDAAGLDHRTHRGRHDIRDPDRRHRSVGRVPPRPRRHSGCDRRQRVGWAIRFIAASAGTHVGAPWYARWRPMATGAVCGGAQGIAITRLKVPPFVVTLGGLSAFRGLTLWVSGASPVSGFDLSIRWWGQGAIGPVPVPVVLFLVRGRDLPCGSLANPLWPTDLRCRRQSRGRASRGDRQRPDHRVGLCDRRRALRASRASF